MHFYMLERNPFALFLFRFAQKLFGTVFPSTHSGFVRPECVEDESIHKRFLIQRSVLSRLSGILPQDTPFSRRVLSDHDHTHEDGQIDFLFMDFQNFCDFGIKTTYQFSAACIQSKQVKQCF
ncbi:hypothetical protein AVEN_6637-1, partial [Araneus ventricosus]